MQAENPVHRARSYPYPRPHKSFIFVDGSTLLLEEPWTGVERLSQLHVKDYNAQEGFETAPQTAQEAVAARHGLDLKRYLSSNAWTPILAIGSNASPIQLIRKYHSHYSNSLEPGHVVIPVVQAVLEDFDVVYAPSLAPYGSCPATLEFSPGTAVEVFITFLTAPLAALMHETEFPVYKLARLDQVRLHLDTSLESHQQQQAMRASSNGHAPLTTTSTACGRGAIWTDVMCYQYACGSLVLPVDGSSHHPSPVSIAEIPAAGRTFPALTQPQLLHTLRRALAEPAPLHPIAMAVAAGGGGGPGSYTQLYTEPTADMAVAVAAAACTAAGQFQAEVAAGPPVPRSARASLSSALVLGGSGPQSNGSSSSWSAAAATVYLAADEESPDDAAELDAWLLQVIGSKQLRISLKQRMQAHACAKFRYPPQLVEEVQVDEDMEQDQQEQKKKTVKKVKKAGSAPGQAKANKARASKRTHSDQGEGAAAAAGGVKAGAAAKLVTSPAARTKTGGSSRGASGPAADAAVWPDATQQEQALVQQGPVGNGTKAVATGGKKKTKKNSGTTSVATGKKMKQEEKGAQSGTKSRPRATTTGRAVATQGQQASDVATHKTPAAAKAVKTKAAPAPKAKPATRPKTKPGPGAGGSAGAQASPLGKRPRASKEAAQAAQGVGAVGLGRAVKRQRVGDK